MRICIQKQVIAVTFIPLHVT